MTKTKLHKQAELEMRREVARIDALMASKKLTLDEYEMWMRSAEFAARFKHYAITRQDPGTVHIERNY